MIIKSINANETYSVRHPVLRPERPIEECYFELTIIHQAFTLGWSSMEKLLLFYLLYQLSVRISLNLMSMRLRGIATLHAFQKRFCSQLMIEVEKRLIKLKKIRLIWLNARTSAKSFYQNLGYETMGKLLMFGTLESSIHV